MADGCGLTISSKTQRNGFNLKQTLELFGALGRMNPLKPASRQSKASEDFGAFAARTLRSRWRKYRRQLKKCRQACTESSVHHLRVAIRRLGSALEVFATVHTSRALRKAAGRLERQLGLLGPLRDTHVQWESIQELLPRFPGLEKISRFLKKEEKKSVRALGRKIRKIKVEKIGRLIKGDLIPALGRLTAPGQQAKAKRGLRRSIDQAFAAVAEKHASLDASDAGSIHALRIAFKHFRYRVEALLPILPEITRAHLEQMRRWQLAMGRIQDLEILLHLIQSFRSERTDPGPPDFRAVEKLLTGQQASAVEAFVHSAGQVAGFWKAAAPSRARGVRAQNSER